MREWAESAGRGPGMKLQSATLAVPCYAFYACDWEALLLVDLVSEEAEARCA